MARFTSFLLFVILSNRHPAQNHPHATHPTYHPSASKIFFHFYGIIMEQFAATDRKTEKMATFWQHFRASTPRRNFISFFGNTLATLLPINSISTNYKTTNYEKRNKTQQFSPFPGTNFVPSAQKVPCKSPDNYRDRGLLAHNKHITALSHCRISTLLIGFEFLLFLTYPSTTTFVYLNRKRHLC